MEMNNYKKLGTTKAEIIDGIRTLNLNGPISDDYIGHIAEAVADDVVRDLWETADHEYWNDDDLRLAFGRVLMDKLGIEY